MQAKHVALNWARRLKRVFGIEQCARCGGGLEVIASIEEPELIERILAHRRERGEEEAMTVSLGVAPAADETTTVSVALTAPIPMHARGRRVADVVEDRIR